MTKQADIDKLKHQTRHQVQVVPDKDAPYALDGTAHVKEADARTAQKDFILAQVAAGALFGTDPRAGEFPDAVYLTGGPDGHLRVRVIERSAWDALPADESDAQLATAAEETKAAEHAAQQAELERVQAEAALFSAKRDASRDETEQAQFAKLATRAEQDAKRLADQIEDRALEAKRAEVLSAARR